MCTSTTFPTMSLIRFVIFLLICCYLLSCNPTTEKSLPAEVQFTNLSDELFACESKEAVLQFLEKYPFLTTNYFNSIALNNTIIAEKLHNNIRSQDLLRFKENLDSLFSTNLPTLKNQLETAFGAVKNEYPDFPIPRVVTMMSGFLGNDLYVSDSLIIIGLDYFGGPKALYRPDVYDYQLRRYQSESIVPSILFFLSDKYNRVNPGDRTLLSEMIGYGKAFEFVKTIMPSIPDSLVMGYSQESLEKTYASQTAVWAFFVSNKLLYETNEIKKQKYIGERPFTNEMGPEVPGAIGRWVGWRIVSSYMTRHPKTTLAELMKEENAAKILQESGYKGQVD
jgi:hypothetical protein